MEHELVQRAKSGDELAFRQLVEVHSAVAWRTARLLLRDAGAAEDAVQEAWIDAWRALPRFQLDRPFRPWLLTLVVNRSRMALRRRRPPTVALDDGPGDELARAADEPPVFGAAGDPALAATLGRLPADHRQVLALRFFAELELPEIAAVVGVPTGTVKSRLHRALARLRAELADRTGAAPRSAEGP